MERQFKEISLQECCDFLMYEHQFSMYVNDDKKRFQITNLLKDEYICLYYKTTMLPKNRWIGKTELINELFPLLRREKINKILKR